MVKKWIEAQGNVEKLRTFINTQLAETFEENSEQIKDLDWLLARREKYPAELPEEVGLLTAGVDVQPNRLEAEVVGWGIDEESWSIDNEIIPGDPSDPDTWRMLDSYLNQPWFRYDGKCTYVAAACIDMHGGFTQEVTQFCRTRINRKFWPVRGVGGDGQARPVWPNNPSRGGQYDTPFYNIGVDSAKNTVFTRLLIKSEGPGYCHFPDNRSSEWFQQLTAEKRVTKWKGARKILVWDNPKKARNEAFDCRVYAYSALCGLVSEGLNLNDIVGKGKFIMSKPIHKRESPSEDFDGKEKALKKSNSRLKSNRQRVIKSEFMN
jgi:phage terminase large subunit GpA-like protein